MCTLNKNGSSYLTKNNTIIFINTFIENDIESADFQ